ncbi:hypothetical protein OH492_28000 [Vibrio chagasii]|nr:hypothetical protein [Vibrio chagasii]
MVIYDSTGTVECGLVCVGGNNDTVYVQPMVRAALSCSTSPHTKRCTGGCHFGYHSPSPVWISGGMITPESFGSGVEKCFYEEHFALLLRGRGPTMVPHGSVSQSKNYQRKPFLLALVPLQSLACVQQEV